MEALLEQAMRMLLPAVMTNDFDLTEITETEHLWKVRLEEKMDRKPVATKDKTVCLDGFCNPIELQSFPAKGKEVYLYVYRRRWRCKEEDKVYSNDYDLHLNGMKATKEFGSFLKEINR